MRFVRYRYGRRLHLIFPGDDLPACTEQGAPLSTRWATATRPERESLPWCQVCAEHFRSQELVDRRLLVERHAAAQLVLEHLLAHDWPLPACAAEGMSAWLEAQSAFAARRIEREGARA